MTQGLSRRAGPTGERSGVDAGSDDAASHDPVTAPERSSRGLRPEDLFADDFLSDPPDDAAMDAEPEAAEPEDAEFSGAGPQGATAGDAEREALLRELRSSLARAGAGADAGEAPAPGAGYTGGAVGQPPQGDADDSGDVLQLTDPDPGSGGGLVEIHPDMPKVNPNLVFGATLALWQPPRFTPQELVDTINEILEGTGAVAQFDAKMKQAGDQPKFSLLKRRLKGPPSATLRVNGLLTLVGGGDRPAFSGQALEQRVNPALWADGVKRLSQSRGHVMVADAHPNNPNDPDLNYDRAVAVTVTAAAVSLLTDPAGIVWHPAGNATPPDVIPDFVQSLADGLAPLPLWLRWLLVPPTHGLNAGAVSRGLEALLGMEMEIAPNKKTLEVTVGHLFQLAAIHVRLGKAPPDGSQVGTKDKTWYHVQYVRKGAVSKTPIYRLTPVTAYTGG